MAEDRPLTGFGLGTFPSVYPRYAIRDFPVFANHAHNDWAEFASEGGIPFLLIVLIPFVLAIPAMIRNPWALGLLAVMLHACVDYPFPRPAVSGWIFALLGILYTLDAPRLPSLLSRAHKQAVTISRLWSFIGWPAVATRRTDPSRKWRPHCPPPLQQKPRQ